MNANSAKREYGQFDAAFTPTSKADRYVVHQISAQMFTLRATQYIVYLQ